MMYNLYDIILVYIWYVKVTANKSKGPYSELEEIYDDVRYSSHRHFIKWWKIWPRIKSSLQGYNQGVIRSLTPFNKWATSWQNQQNDCASAQSDQSSLRAHWIAKDPSFLHADSDDSDQTGRTPRLIWVFAGRTVILLVLSWGGSYMPNGLFPPYLLDESISSLRVPGVLFHFYSILIDILVNKV